MPTAESGPQLVLWIGWTSLVLGYSYLSRSWG